MNKKPLVCLRLAIPAMIGAALWQPASLQAVDVVHADDVIVEGSICLSDDNACASGEVFPANADIKIKDALPVILFEDTSASSSPDRHYRITIGGAGTTASEYFAIEDAGSSGTGNTQVFRVDGGARANALHIDSSGEVGIGTATPAFDVHVVTGNTPGLRLEQDGSSNFTPQIWDIYGNEGIFELKDTTHSNRRPFRVQPNANDTSLYIATGGRVGFGTSSPVEEIHVRRSDDANTIIRAENTSSVGANSAGAIQSKADVAQVSFQSHGSGRTISRFGETLGGWNEMLGVFGNGFIIGTLFDVPLIFGTNGQNRLEITPGGDVVHFSAGTVHPDFVFEPSYELESIERHAEAMWRKKHLPAVGAGEYTEDGRAMFKLGAGRAGMLEELEKAHIYIEQLHEEAKLKDERTAALEKSAAELRQGNADLAARVERLEALIAAAIDGGR